MYRNRQPLVLSVPGRSGCGGVGWREATLIRVPPEGVRREPERERERARQNQRLRTSMIFHRVFGNLQ
eukprot:2751795-Amphidinium_carterae.1